METSKSQKDFSKKSHKKDVFRNKQLGEQKIAASEKRERVNVFWCAGTFNGQVLCSQIIC